MPEPTEADILRELLIYLEVERANLEMLRSFLHDEPVLQGGGSRPYDFEVDGE